METRFGLPVHPHSEDVVPPSSSATIGVSEGFEKK